MTDYEDAARSAADEAEAEVERLTKVITAAREALDAASVPLGMSVMRFWDHKIIEVRRILSEGLEPTGVCYCGMDMKDHRGWEGHSPIQMPAPEVTE